MSSGTLEGFLARLYTDETLRRAFLAAPEAVIREAGLDEEAARAMARVDREGLLLAAHSFALKRALHAGKRRGNSALDRMLRLFGR